MSGLPRTAARNTTGRCTGHWSCSAEQDGRHCVCVQDHTPRTGRTVECCQCGSPRGESFESEPDAEGLVDCPNCGIWFRSTTTERNTTMTTPDEIWNALTPAAKADWVRCMQPQPAPELPDLSDDRPTGEPIDKIDVERIVNAYVATVRGNDSAAWPARLLVINAIAHDGFAGHATRYDIASEMAEVAHHLGIPAPDVDAEPEARDAYMDVLFDALPTVSLKLKGTN